MGSSKPLWREDECLRHDPDSEKFTDAFKRLTGAAYSDVHEVEAFDGGDHTMHRMSNGFVTYHGYDGYAIYPPGTPLGPQRHS